MPDVDGLPYPLGTDPGNFATHIENLARAQAARNSTYPRAVLVTGLAAGTTAAIATANTAAIQSAINSLKTATPDVTAGGEVFIPAGLWYVNNEIVLPSDGRICVRLRGAGPGVGGGNGRGATRLEWLADLGAGKFAIRGETLDGTFCQIQDLTLYGPAGGPTAVGQSPAAMDGIRVERGINVRDCRIQRFHAGLAIWGDHLRVERSDSGGNYYGVYFPSAVPTQGDIFFTDLNLTGNRLASMAVGPTGLAAAVTVLHGHMGFCPYGVYFEAGGTAGQQRMSAVQWLGTSFEYCENGAFYDPDRAAGVYNQTFIGCGSFSTSGSASGLPGGIDAHFCLGGFTGSFIECNIGVFTPFNIAVLFDGGVLGGGNGKVHFDLDLRDLNAKAAALATPRPLIRAKEASNASWRFASESGRVVKPQTNVTARQMVGWQAGGKVNNLVTQWPGTVMGVALNTAPGDAATAQECLLVVEQGLAVPVVASSAIDTSATTQRLVKVDPASRNQVISYAAGDKFVVGMLAAASGVGPGNVTIDLHPGSLPA